MKVFQDVHIKSKVLTDQKVLDALKQFARQTKGWTVMEESSEEYSEHIANMLACSF